MNSQPDRIILYDTPGSPCARRVRMTLLEKELPFDRVILDLAKMENKADWYLAINPNGQVPAIQIGRHTLYESNVITEYLDNVWPVPRLYPQNPLEYAQVKAWQTFEAVLSKHFGMLQYVRLLGPLSRIQYSYADFMAEARKRTTDPALLQWESKVWRGEVLSAEQENAYESALYERLDVIEAALQGRRYLVGDAFSQAEISIYPRVAMYPYIRLPIVAERYPNLTAWMRRLHKRPAFIRSSTIVDRAMQDGRLARLLHMVDPLSAQSQSVLKAAGVRLVRQLFAQDVMRTQALVDRLKRLPPRRRNAQLPPRSTVISATPQRSPGIWRVYGCPFNTETRIVVATLLATDTPFEFHLVWSPLGAEFRHEHSALTGLSEVPVVFCDKTLVQGWPYVLSRIAEREGRSRLYPAEAYQRAQVQIGCMGDLVVNYKYKRPLFWQAQIQPWLRTHFATAEPLRQLLLQNTVDSTHGDFVMEVWSGGLIDQDAETACLGLLRQRVQWVGRAVHQQGWLATNTFTLADIAEWVRTEEALQLGLEWQPDEAFEGAAHAWYQRISEMPFVAHWRSWLDTQMHAPVSNSVTDSSTNVALT